MRQSRFTEVQIIVMIKEQEAGRQAAKGPQARTWIANADASGFAPRRALVIGFCV